MKIIYTNQWLEKYANRISLKLFGIGYHSPTRWNNRLSTTAGRFFSLTKHTMFETIRNKKHFAIDICTKIVKKHPNILPKIVGHELCHYYSFINDLPYCDCDSDFQDLLKAKHLPASLSIYDNPKRYEYYCPHCHKISITRGKLRKKYSCAICDPKRFDKRYTLHQLGRFELKGSYYNINLVHNKFIKAGRQRLAKISPVSHPVQLSLFN